MTPQFRSVLKFPEQFSKAALTRQFGNEANMAIFPVEIEKFLRNVDSALILADPKSSVTFVNFVTKKKVSEATLITWCYELHETL